MFEELDRTPCYHHRHCLLNGIRSDPSLAHLSPCMGTFKDHLPVKLALQALT